eukprot:GEMP01007566.1.p1 GENE.GEMP01007566.1~~GEMP01007566.1.p1  ORF type:complete len:418 (+),score=68.67 GEMP01007566.1:381-1634(+)
MRGRVTCGKVCCESRTRDNSSAANDEYSTLGRRFRREILLFKHELPLVYVVMFLFMLYCCMFPLRRLSHYNHKTLDYYWPPRYAVPASLATITLNNTRNGNLEHVLLDDYLARVAPHHGLDLKRITIQKYDFVKACDGCIDQPLRLHDIGHRTISDWSQTENPLISEFFMLLIIVSGILVGCIPAFQRAPKVYVLSLWVRTCRVGAMLHVIRPLFHIVTALPGTPMHCQSKVVRGGGGHGLHGPHLYPHGDSLGAFLALLFTVKGGKSCGDLMYSGHMVNCTLLVCSFTFYRKQVLPLHPTLSVLMACFAVALLSVQAFLILAFRNHYTVDVVGSTLLTVLIYRLDIHFLPEFVSTDSTSAPDVSTKEDDVCAGRLALAASATVATAVSMRRCADCVARLDDDSIDDLEVSGCQTSV